MHIIGKNVCLKSIIRHPIPSLTVNEKNEKFRLVLALRDVNSYLHETKFRYENLKKVAELFESDYSFITFDLKSGYHHVPINPSSELRHVQKVGA